VSVLKLSFDLIKISIFLLEVELTELKPLLDELTDSQREKISKSLSGQTTAFKEVGFHLFYNNRASVCIKAVV
jgi:hypothetical protein